MKAINSIIEKTWQLVDLPVLHLCFFCFNIFIMSIAVLSQISVYMPNSLAQPIFVFLVLYSVCTTISTVKCTYTTLDSIAYYTPRLYGIAYCY